MVYIGCCFWCVSLQNSKNNAEKKRERTKQQQQRQRRRRRQKKIVFIENKTKQADSFVHILSVFHGKIIQI